MRILVVDEAAFVRDSLKRALRRFLSNADIFDAVNGNRALPVLRTNKIDLVIADWELSDMPCAELIQWMRNEEKYQKTPFVVISSALEKDKVMNAIQAGANDFMAKPFSPDELQKKVVKQLSRIGYRPNAKRMAQNSGTSSLEALTGGGSSAAPASAQKPRANTQNGAGLLTGQTPPPSRKKVSTKSSQFPGMAQLTVNGQNVPCAVIDASLTAMNLVMERNDSLPALLTRAQVDIADNTGEPIATLNVYIHALQAAEASPEASRIKVNIRFIDNDPDNFELLSKLIARSR